AVPQVRAFLLDLQRDMARQNNVVMDGRDIGTVVLPDAAIKIFLTASAEERARRRYEEHIQKGDVVAYEDVLADMKTRDHNDETRAAAPLRKADDAILVDTTGNALEKSIDIILDIVRRESGTI
ncbi:MAG: (d)CMP kinase, partial [Oscillospiraceae bacterium]|nr:(d)CMP kinase [Oscillospiraceae bacterium]